MGRRRKPRRELEHLTRPTRFERRHSLPQRALIDRRRSQAYSLKMRGLSLVTIGLHLHADPAHNTNKIGFEGGYGWRNYHQGKPAVLGVNLGAAVSSDISKGLRQARVTSESVRQEALTLQLEQHELAASQLWPAVMNGNARAHEVWLANMARQAELMGINPADEINVTITHEGPQPQFDNAYASAMMDALKEVGAVDVTTTGEFIAFLDATPIEDAELVPVANTGP